jgi:hypothetical protein
MPEAVRIWEILDGDSLKEIKSARLDLEERVENWLERDISIISNDLLVIGRQIETDFGGVIDLLCLDYSGDVVILELKRDKTPREITLVKRFQSLSGIPKVERSLANGKVLFAGRPISEIGVLVRNPTGKRSVRLMLSKNPYHVSTWPCSTV